MPNFSGPILVPIGFSEQSIVALEQAVNIAKITDAELFLLSVVEEPSALQKMFVNYKDNQDEMKSLVREKLDALQEQHCSTMVRDTDCMVSTGVIYDKIVEVADMIGASLIVMGTDAADKRTKKKMIGSNASNVVRSAPCPVVTIKGKEHRQGCDVIILPLDLQKETREKVTTAIQYARFWNAEVRVFSVLATGDEDVENKLTRALGQVNTFISDAGIRCSSELISVPQGKMLPQEVLDYSEKTNTDLIMVMIQEESGFSSHFMGSTAQFVIAQSEIPVMSIHPTKKRDTTHYVV